LHLLRHSDGAATRFSHACRLLTMGWGDSGDRVLTVRGCWQWGEVTQVTECGQWEGADSGVRWLRWQSADSERVLTVGWGDSGDRVLTVRGCWVGVLCASLSTGAGKYDWGCWAPPIPHLATHYIHIQLLTCRNKARNICWLSADILCGRPPDPWPLLIKMGTLVTPPWGTFTPILVFLRLFAFELRARAGRTGQDSLLGQPLNKYLKLPQVCNETISNRTSCI